jgi:N-dimethylarginine dimethylaminohydrolase
MNSPGNDSTARPWILMCSPDFYGIEYEINAWMQRERQSDPAEAMRQWTALRRLLEEAGARISLVAPQPGLPDLVFTANAGLVYQNRVMLARFRHAERRGEEPHFERWFREQGFEVERAPGDYEFEGAGDALFCGDTLFAGYRIRSHAAGHQAIGQRLGCRVIPLELVNPHFYHLDTCFCPLAADTALYFPGAFDDYGRRVLGELVPRLVEVGDDEARRFACNAVVVGRRVITNSGCPRLADDLRSLGYEPQETLLDEFVKAGGSAKCLTLRLDGEDAAAWRTKSGDGRRETGVTNPPPFKGGARGG